MNALPPARRRQGDHRAGGPDVLPVLPSERTGGLDSIRTSQLPLFHSAAIHGSPDDTGNSAITDSIRVVRMTVTGLYNDPDKGAIMKTVESSTKLINAGMVRATMCGDVPLAVTTATATLVTTGFPPVPSKVAIDLERLARPGQRREGRRALHGLQEASASRRLGKPDR